MLFRIVSFKKVTILIKSDKFLQLFASFAQWRYHSQWDFVEVWLLLVENYSQYPAQTTLTGRLVQFFTALTGAKD